MTFQKVIELSQSCAPVGISQQSLWVYETREGDLVALGHQHLFMVTILELGDALKPLLIRGLEAQGLETSLANTFPSHIGVRMGLTWPTDYWQGLAVQWVERDGSEAEFFPELEALVTKGGTQRIRHVARRLARRAICGPTPQP